ncbi:MAG: molecular chaperone [Verrucomicrobia bacterium]|nr:molecular chaperone [Verrucomicrobiota bacterium]
MTTRELLIYQIPQVEVDGSGNIPTALFYEPGDKVLIGSAALAAAEKPQELNLDFKLDLGYSEASGRPKRLFRTACGDRRSAQALTADFLREVLRSVSEWLAKHGVEHGTSVLLAEPLAMQSSPEWLATYRKNLREILEKRRFEGIDNINFANIDFLPEPFAVFQYYRYGVRYGPVADRKKNQALVLDFGGGTLDVCIIETTKDGDISGSGRNSKPFAAASEPIGGFFVNRMIAEHLFRKHLIQSTQNPRVGSMFAKGLDIYTKWRRNEDDLSTRDEDYRQFVQHFHNTVYLVEGPKISICKSILDWRLDAPLNVRVSVRLPRNPFSTDSTEQIDVSFSATELREIFVREVWERQIRGVVARTLQRGQAELCSAPITVVLLSGGSANIGWLEQLLRRDFADELSIAEVLHLPDYQEVVSKGLAVECARRFYSKQGDFCSVTYNRLCLVLDPNSRGPQQCLFSPKTDDLPKSDTPGVLIPSASLLKGLIGKPLRWKVHRLASKPKRLDYYFLRSSFDPQDTENLQNIEEHTVRCPPDCPFDSEIKVELLVTEDGTAKPRFIYKTGRDEIASNGKPFYLDMTYGQEAPVANAYIGLDFGTSNTSVSFVNHASIQVHQTRSSDTAWNELKDLAQTLPYPLAAPLASFVSETHQVRLQDRGREFIEAALAIAAYISFLEFCTQQRRFKSQIFKNFTQRSAGPLWALLRQSLDKLPKITAFAHHYRELLTSDLIKIIDDAVDFIADVKHHKASLTAIDIKTPVQILANVSQKVFDKCLFGTFEDVKKRSFAANFEGRFREATGRPPFVKCWLYTGTDYFAEQEPFLVNMDKEIGLSLAPLLFWKSCETHPDADFGHCYIFDILARDEATYSYKAVGYPCSCEITAGGDYGALAERLMEFRQSDPTLHTTRIGALREV